MQNNHHHHHHLRRMSLLRGRWTWMRTTMMMMMKSGLALLARVVPMAVRPIVPTTLPPPPPATTTGMVWLAVAVKPLSPSRSLHRRNRGSFLCHIQHSPLFFFIFFIYYSFDIHVFAGAGNRPVLVILLDRQELLNE